MSDYTKYRGNCKVLSEKAIKEDPTLTLVRGFYHCPFWGKQHHWWTKRPDGTIYDPTKDQFPSKGIGEYEEFDGIVECETCHKKIEEEYAIIQSKYAFCSQKCFGIFVGVIKES